MFLFLFKMTASTRLRKPVTSQSNDNLHHPLRVQFGSNVVGSDG